MNALGTKIAGKRKELGMTQIEFAEKLMVTRQTVSRWEAGTVMPDIEKIADIASLLEVSCDYLLKDEQTEDTVPVRGISRLIQNTMGRRVRLNFFDDEADIDLYDTDCTILDFEGNRMKVSAETKKGHVEKLIPLSSVMSLEILEENA